MQGVAEQPVPCSPCEAAARARLQLGRLSLAGSPSVMRWIRIGVVGGVIGGVALYFALNS